MDRQLLLYLALGLLALGGCAGDPGEAGPRGGDGDEGASCTVTTAGDKATIVCPDGSETVLEASSCSVESARGVHTIQCPGADPVVLNDGDRIRNGSIAGSAIRYGLPPMAGIEVELVGPSAEQVRPRVTDAEGAFQLTAVPAGLHRVRIQAPGYQTLEIPNVLVLGGAVELGEQLLKRGRLLGNGYLEPILSPNEAWVALLHLDPFGGGSSFGVTVVGTGDDSVHWLGDELIEFQFIDDRYAMIHRRWDVYNYQLDLSLFDLERGELIEVGPVVDYALLSGGLLTFVLEGLDLAARFLALPSREVHELGAGFPYHDLDVWHFGERFWRIGGGEVPDQLRLFDSEAPDRPMRSLASPNVAREEETGLVAFAAMGEAEPEIRVFDPTTDEDETFGPHPPGGQLRWSSDGAYLAVSSGGEVRIIARETGAETPWSTPASQGVEFSPSGALLVVSDVSGALLGDWRSGVSVAMPSRYVTFSPTERWAAACSFGTVRIVDTEDLSAADYPIACDDFYFLDDLLFVISWDRATRIDPTTGATQLFEVSANHLPNAKAISFDAGSGELIIVDMRSGETLPTGFEDSDFVWTENPDYLLVIVESGDEVHLVDLSDGTSAPIGPQLIELEIGASGFAYTGGAPLFFFPAATSGGGGLFDGIETYWVPFP